EQLGDAASGGGFVIVGPVSRENLIGLAPEQEIAFLLKDAVDLFAEHLIEIRHHPAAELEALRGILPRPAGRLHDSIHGKLGADNDLSTGSLSSIAYAGNAGGRRPLVLRQFVFVDSLGITVSHEIEPYTIFKERFQARQHQGESLRRFSDVLHQLIASAG